MIWDLLMWHISNPEIRTHLPEMQTPDVSLYYEMIKIALLSLIYKSPTESEYRASSLVSTAIRNAYYNG